MNMTTVCPIAVASETIDKPRMAMCLAGRRGRWGEGGRGREGGCGGRLGRESPNGRGQESGVRGRAKESRVEAKGEGGLPPVASPGVLLSSGGDGSTDDVLLMCG